MATSPQRIQLRTGPDWNESERIATLESAGAQDGVYEFSFRLDFRGFDWISGIACYLPEPTPELSLEQQGQLAEAAVAAFLPELEKRFPPWFQRCILWDRHVRTLDSEQFLRWLETQRAELPRVLGVFAVQERLFAFRNLPPKQRKAAADTIARLLTGVATGRPKAPVDVTLYHGVRTARNYLRPVYEALQRANAEPTTSTSAWNRFQLDHGDLAHDLSSLTLRGKSLRDRWFSWGPYRGAVSARAARQSPRRRDVSPLSLAYEYVAAVHRLAPVTVERRYENVNARRSRKR